MKKLPRWLILLVLLCAAITSYLVGSIAGFGLFIIFGLLFEAGFWLKLFNKSNGS